MPKRIDGGIALLADPTRRRLIAAIAVRPAMRPSKLAVQLGLSRSAVSRQLGRLSEAGLVIAHGSYVDGRWISYSVNPDRQGQILAWLAGTEIGLDERAARRDANPQAGRAQGGADLSASEDSAVVAANGNDRSTE